ncbi:glycosyl hydrolase family 65 protein [Streptomyces sp. B22F1]|uniref:glycoside hydrolase family 65 protein n=1 Tax=Streptomyces sp. B22F1 TaxID=3153566 RepID=UPI00325CD959
MSDDWTWTYEGYDPSQERLREALCTLGNGNFATRGAAPESGADETHYPGTYAAGVYDRLTSTVSGRQVENEDMVNLPNWLPLRFRARPPAAAPGRWLATADADPVAYRRRLRLRTGVLERSAVFTDAEGRRIELAETRLVHMGVPHLAALRTTLTPLGWSGELEVEAALDGSVTNSGVARYRAYAGRHLTRVETGADDPDTVWLCCRTRASGVRVALAARTRVAAGDVTGSRPVRHGDSGVARLLSVRAVTGEPVTVEKTVALSTSRDPAHVDPLRAAREHVSRSPDFTALLASHTAAWDHLWQRTGLCVPGKAGGILRLHLFHLLQTLSPHTARLDAGVPARGLHGEAYRGHVFWDELFVLPYLNLHLPEVSRALLDYRHRRLPAARRAAAAAGYRGAMYPWQSGSDGREETQEMHLNPRSGHWLPDHSRLQHHVGLAVAYNVWQYGQATGDTAYLYGRGAETVLEVARFFADLAAWDPAYGRHRIRGVLGPDEYHDAYPDARRPGLDDNAYTNVMAAWVLARARELLAGLPGARRRELAGRMRLGEEETTRWEEVSRTLHVPFHRDVISQFEGYGELADFDWDGYRSRYGDIRRLDRILEAEGDSVNRYQASKQADVLMLGYLFSPAELGDVFGRLGHRMDDELWRRTVDYYLARTSHGSTLSSLVHGWVLARARRSSAWTYCQEALASDVADIQGGTTGEGIHLGAMAGTLDMVQRGLTGLAVREDALWLDPVPMPQMSEYVLRLRYRGHRGIELRLRAGRLHVDVPQSAEPPLTLVLPDRTVTVEPGESRRLRLPDA